MSVLKELAIVHPYYCSDSNYYSNQPRETYGSVTEFLEEYEDADIDMNLCFRWDVRENEETEGYYVNIFIMQQRKGIFKPITIGSVTEEEAVRLKAYLQRHAAVLAQMWKPLDLSETK